MAGPRVAIVSKDPAVRLAAATAFDVAPAAWEVGLYREVPDAADVVVFGPDIDAPVGAVVLDPHEPQRALDAVRERMRRGRGFLVASPGGGAGATTVALHLTACLARGSSACLIDLDTRWGARYRLGIGDDALTWADAGTDRETLMRAALPVPGGFRVLLSPGDASLPEPSFLDRAAGVFERLVIDAVGVAALHLGAAFARAGILVLAPSLPQARRARRILEEHNDLPWAVIANKLGHGSEATRADIERELGRPIALTLPCAPALRDAEDDGALLTTPWCRWARGISRLARALVR